MPDAPSAFDFDRSKLRLTYDVERLQQATSALVEGFPPYFHYSVVPLTTPGEINPEITDFSNPDWTTWVETPLLKELI